MKPARRLSGSNDTMLNCSMKMDFIRGKLVVIVRMFLVGLSCESEMMEYFLIYLSPLFDKQKPNSSLNGTHGGGYSKKKWCHQCCRVQKKSGATDKRKKLSSSQISIYQSIAFHRIERLTQRTVKFIRWLKSHLDIDRNWDESVARLQQIYSRS
jgi:hypothetical protein